MSEAGAYSTDQSVGDSRARGRRDNPVVQSGFKSTEAYAPSAMSETDSVAPVLTSAFHLNPLPQSRTNDGPMPTLQVSPQSELQEKRGKFIDRFSEGDWNDPNAVYPELSTALTQIKALVVAIDYGPSYHLPATYTDACSIIEMLENQFRYPPKCIRVLADMVDRENNKDARWPNKANIIKGLEWLIWIQQKLTGRVAVVSVAGHGYSQDFKNGEDNYTEEGILPRDYLSIVPYEERRKPHPKEAIDKSTILLDVELNQCLVKGLADGLKLTVMFDCCYSGGLSESVPDFRDMSHLRSRHLFARQPTQMIGQPGVRKLCAPLGNLLDLPVKVELGGSEPIKALARSSLPEIPGGMYYEPNEFSAFPEKSRGAHAME
ncbi:hypothetical protein FRC07_003799 [Ceratobasidium sp. 392]|nr:hypothetical protein FRC07_003799 [Ceratobasidium sp. 392]